MSEKDKETNNALKKVLIALNDPELSKHLPQIHEIASTYRNAPACAIPSEEAYEFIRQIITDKCYYNKISNRKREIIDAITEQDIKTIIEKSNKKIYVSKAGHMTNIVLCSYLANIDTALTKVIKKEGNVQANDLALDKAKLALDESRAELEESKKALEDKYNKYIKSSNYKKSLNKTNKALRNYVLLMLTRTTAPKRVKEIQQTIEAQAARENGASTSRADPIAHSSTSAVSQKQLLIDLNKRPTDEQGVAEKAQKQLTNSAYGASISGHEQIASDDANAWEGLADLLELPRLHDTISGHKRTSPEPDSEPREVSNPSRSPAGSFRQASVETAPTIKELVETTKPIKLLKLTNQEMLDIIEEASAKGQSA